MLPRQEQRRARQYSSGALVGLLREPRRLGALEALHHKLVARLLRQKLGLQLLLVGKAALALLLPLRRARLQCGRQRVTWPLRGR